jgi:hypothetical protein
MWAQISESYHSGFVLGRGSILVQEAGCVYLGSSWFILAPLGKFWHGTLKKAKTPSFYILHIQMWTHWTLNELYR